MFYHKLLNNIYEPFEKINNSTICVEEEENNEICNGLLCGTKNDICRIDEYGVSSCCNGYECVRPEGEFHHKICRIFK